MSFREWKEVRLKDIIEFNPSETIKKGSVAKKITMEKLNPFQRKIEGFELADYSGGTKFRNGDTLLARITPCLENGKTAQVSVLDKDEIGFGSTEFIVLREKSGYSVNDFVYYLAISPLLRELAIKSMTGTSGRQRAQKDVIENTIVEIPPIEEQKVIAHILSTLDEKIEVNDQINRTLESMAQEIFKHWFVNYEFPNENGEPYNSNGGEMIDSELGMIPKGWDVKNLDEIADFQNGYAFYQIGYTNDGIKVVDLANVDVLGNFIETERDKYISIDVYSQERMNKFKLIKNDLVMIMTDRTQEMNILGKTGKIPYSDKYILNQRVGRIRAKDSINVNYLRSVLNSDRVREYLKGVSLGSVQKYVNTDHIKKIKILIPTNDVMYKYSLIADLIYEKMLNNNEENSTILSLRDTLLPKLMSGEIRVPLDNNEVSENHN